MAIDYKFIKQNHLEESVNRLRKINEYIVNPNNTNEADDPNQGQQPPMDGGQDPNMGGGAMPPQDGGQAPDMGQQPPMGGAPDMNQGGMPPQGGQDIPVGTEVPGNGGDEMGGMPEGGDMGEMPEGDETVGEEDEVIDIDDLTNSQEAAEYKIDGVDDKLSKLMGMVAKFEKAIEASDAKIEDLKSEFEKRNPTNMERINIRSMNSKPFNVNPTEYWDEEKEKNPNYNIISDNSVSPDKEDKVYTITDDDLGDFTSGDLEKSFNKFPKELKDYFA